jgi:hypothetical protein
MTKKQTKPNAARPDYVPTSKEVAVVQRVFDRGEAAAPAPRFKVRNNKISLDYPDRLTATCS